MIIVLVITARKHGYGYDGDESIFEKLAPTRPHLGSMGTALQMKCPCPPIWLDKNLGSIYLVFFFEAGWLKLNVDGYSKSKLELAGER